MEVSQLIFNPNSANPKALQTFYADVIGLDPNPQMGDGALLAAGTPFIVDGHSDLTGPTKEPPRTMANFAVDDLVAETQRLEALGVEFLVRRGPPAPQEIAFATFIDPDGGYGQIFQMDGAPAGTRMFAVSRNTEDPEGMRAFYRDVVGLSEGPVEVGSPFMVGGAALYISPHSEITGKAQEPARVLLNFMVADLAAEQRRIESHGVEFIRTAGREPWGGVISTFPDPDGNYLQLIEFRPE